MANPLNFFARWRMKFVRKFVRGVQNRDITRAQVTFARESKTNVEAETRTLPCINGIRLRTASSDITFFFKYHA